MAATDAPRAPIGGISTLSSGYYGTGLPLDDLEHIPAMTWPQSVRTLSQMRTDPVCASILAAYLGPILAADWRINPAGADPDMVRVCADSLGIPVLGEDTDQVGAARRRGVKWLEHLRVAGLHLLWGHLPFEPVYEVRGDGYAYLRALPERLPSTLVAVNVTDDGDLASVVQEARPGKGSRGVVGGVEIPAARLLWYCHGREGGNWVGRSLLRSCYADWLLKVDAKRANAVGINRWSSGIPVAEPLPGTNVTPAQIAEAQAMVSGARGGETTGAVPVGFRLRILGIEGQLPDAVPTIRMHNEEMARGSLTSVLDLGSTSNGSRALGDTFAEMLTTAVQAVADSMAETATQLCERLTTFNRGENAVPPTVVCGDVSASKNAVTAAIAGLVTAGLVTPDPELEGYVRDLNGLPPKAATEPVPVVASARPATGQAWPGAAPLTNEVAVSGLQAAATREPTPEEQAAGIDPQTIQEEEDNLTAEGMALLAAVVLAWGAVLAAGILAALAAGSLVALARLRLQTGDATEALQLLMREAAEVGAQQVFRETRRTTDFVLPTDQLDDSAEALAEHLAQTIAGAVGREAGRRGGDLTEAEVDALVAEITPGPVRRAVERAVAEAMGTGRTVAIGAVIANSPRIDWVIFHSAVRDKGTCSRCVENDGRTYPNLEAGRRDFPLGLYRACEGRDKCRCLLAMRPRTNPTP